MAKRGGGSAEKAVLLIGGAVLLAYLLNGREKNNSVLIPDAIENQIDRVVAALNGMFGKHWVNFTLNVVQRQMELAMPGTAALVNAVYRAEQYYRGQAGAIKKRAALRSLGA